MKKGILIYFIILKAIFANIDEYKVFDMGKHELEKKNFSAAEKFFNTFQETYSNTNLFKSNYPNYFIAMNYYNLKEYKKAIEYFEKSIYIPLENNLHTGYFNKEKEDFFEYERILYTAYSYNFLNDQVNAKNEFLKLYRKYYDYNLIEFEKKSLVELAKFDTYYQNIYDIKFENDFSKLNQLKSDDLLKIGDYIYSRGNFLKASEIYREYLKKQKSDWIEISVLKSLFRAKEHDTVIKLANEYLKTNEQKSYVYYYLGNSTRRKGDIPNAIKYFKEVKKGAHVKESEYLIGRLYFLAKDYDNSKKYLEQSDYMAAKEMLLDLYLENDQKDKFAKEAIKLIVSYPYSDEAAFYRYKLYDITKRGYLEMILKYNPNTLYYEKALEITKKKIPYKNFIVENYEKNYEKELEKIKELSKFEDKNYAKIELSAIKFKESDEIYKKYITSKIFADNELYNEAIRMAYSDHYNFSKYEELNKLLYPKYYEKSVKKYAKIYNVEEELIYSIIKQESVFESNVISSAAAYGLMQLIMPTAKLFDKNIKTSDLLIPDENIRIGTMFLSNLVKTFDGNISLIAAGYNAGPGNAKKWEKDSNGDLIIEKIPFPETKNYVEKVLNNYYKYKRLYKVD